MKHYTFNVVETRESTFEIEAENIHEAEMLARDAYSQSPKFFFSIYRTHSAKDITK